ncbi:MAG: hypothetical protein IPK08_10525 [Bacteroidetes bacterium]|nr:hypothetical protein [Bacteroidota bacterium]
MIKLPALPDSVSQGITTEGALVLIVTVINNSISITRKNTRSKNKFWTDCKLFRIFRYFKCGCKPNTGIYEFESVFSR